MKKTWKFAFAGLVLFGFTACGNNEAETTEAETVETTEEIETDINTELEEDTVTLEENEIDGIIEEEQPPVQ